MITATNKFLRLSLHIGQIFFFFCCFTSQVIAGRSVHLTTRFPGQAWTSSLPVIRAHTFACNWQQPFLNESAEGRRMTVEIISWSISTKVWDRTGIELATPGSAVRHASVARHLTDCATRSGYIGQMVWYVLKCQFLWINIRWPLSFLNILIFKPQWTWS